MNASLTSLIWTCVRAGTMRVTTTRPGHTQWTGMHTVCLSTLPAHQKLMRHTGNWTRFVKWAGHSTATDSH